METEEDIQIRYLSIASFYAHATARCSTPNVDLINAYEFLKLLYLYRHMMQCNDKRGQNYLRCVNYLRPCSYEQRQALSQIDKAYFDNREEALSEVAITCIRLIHACDQVPAWSELK